MSTPPKESAISRVRRFFADNPDEELTRADMLAKFDLSLGNYNAIVEQLRAEGLIESVHVIRNRAKGRAS